jgi:hypothetical protein
MNSRFKVFASYNILQYLCDFIHVLIFVTVSKGRKSPKLMNIVMTEKSLQHSNYSIIVVFDDRWLTKGGFRGFEDSC